MISRILLSCWRPRFGISAVLPAITDVASVEPELAVAASQVHPGTSGRSARATEQALGNRAATGRPHLGELRISAMQSESRATNGPDGESFFRVPAAYPQMSFARSRLDRRLNTSSSRRRRPPGPATSRSSQPARSRACSSRRRHGGADYLVSARSSRLRQQAACYLLLKSAHPIITARSVAFIGDENANCAFAFLSRKDRTMVLIRQRVIQKRSLEQRLVVEAHRFRNEVRGTPPGVERERLVRKALQAEAASQLSEWLRSPGLRAPA